ncbi:hypothetical protein K435DRAFT_209003 [Dendrothele bispora CBS 962.96]|uniref:Uncharacterized protein n=1 Tax=Dendrothele bispora (strain CBS 962.96) TaxID=1314807 RepID=A0A4S8LSV5_DENBC|nr:hypothetical protein K435DRAFT_209003 [Dendrothele bispora CBS 962.96]
MPKHARKRQKLSQSLSKTHQVDDASTLEALLDDTFGTTGKAKKGAAWKDDEDVDGEDVEDEGDEDMEVGGGREMENLLDGDLFFIDSGDASIPGPTFSNSDQSENDNEDDDEDDAPSSSSSSHQKSHPKPNPKSGTAPAWHGPSDPSTSISLSSSKRLCKLRNAPDENELGAREYESRLRRQFEKINPEPEWAKRARLARVKKAKSIRSQGEENDSEDEDDDADKSFDMQTLLNSTSGIVSKRSTKSLILPTGTINIERLRDANISFQDSGGCGDIRSLVFHPSDRVPVLAVGNEDRRLVSMQITGSTWLVAITYQLYTLQCPRSIMRNFSLVLQATTEDAAKDIAAFVGIFFENFRRLLWQADLTVADISRSSPPKSTTKTHAWSKLV